MTETDRLAPVAVAGDPLDPALPLLLRAAAAAHGEREFLALGDRRLSFSEVERRSADLARGLLALGTGKGSRIGIMMANNPDWVLSWCAAGRAGALTILFSTFFQAPEISWCVRHNDVETLLVDARYLGMDYLERLERALPGLAGQTSPDLWLPEHPYLRRIIVWGDCDRPWALKGPADLDALAASNPRIDEAFLAGVEAQVRPSDDLVVICTSGTTAEPKAVLHTHGVALRASYAFLPYLKVEAGDRTYTGQPFFWIGGLNINLFTALYTGSSIIFSPTPEPEQIARVIETEKVTRLTLWPAQQFAVRQAANALGLPLASVRVGLGEPRNAAGAIIPAELRPGGAMGMTETFGMHSMEPVGEPVPAGKGGTWGRVIPGMERKAVDRVTGETLPPGVEGELYVRGPHLMQGYYKREREAVVDGDGWFATGDLVVFDAEGFIYFNGRCTEMIKTSGANVAPKEVEAALSRYPDIREAIVFGVPDAIKGELVVAVVVPASGETPDPDDLRGRLRQDLSPYKVPGLFLFMDFDEIPRTGSAKPRKPDLKARVIAMSEAEAAG